MATYREGSLRNGNKAVELARQANTLTGGENPAILHTLAAALAEAGRFTEAVETGEKGGIRLSASMRDFYGDHPAVILQIVGLVNGGHAAVANHIRDGKAVIEQAAWAKLSRAGELPIGGAGAWRNGLNSELHGNNMPGARLREQSKRTAWTLKFH